jgi:hypothetical protein
MIGNPGQKKCLHCVFVQVIDIIGLFARLHVYYIAEYFKRFSICLKNFNFKEGELFNNISEL